MKTIRMITIFALLMIATSLGMQMVVAQGPDGVDPTTIPFADNQPHSIAANTSLWLRFGYGNSTDAGERATATIRLVNGNHSGVIFEVWPPERVNNTADNKPVGRGTAMNIDCASGQPSEQGQCQTSDLSWTGGFGASGTYFVRVINTNNNSVSFWLTIEGWTVSLPPPTPTSPPTATNTPVMVSPTVVTETIPASVTPTVVTVPTPLIVISLPSEPAVISNADDPNRAVYNDYQPHRLAARSATWFRFDYSTSDDLGDRLTTMIRLVNGNGSGVRFEVWTPDMLSEWWTKQPVGRGTAASADSADLVWKGGFSAGGAYYVRVINDNAITTTFLLTIE
ncbi:hypothetical protein ANRL1_03094 [Anaerolineae bacterium]|nr:hypothetical protein ANRL1_03094 [Anaerolineae bacterium]